MSKGQRVALLVAAAVIAAAAFTVLRPEEEDQAPKQAATDRQSGTGTSGASAGKRPEPELTQIRVRGGKPVGGVVKVSVREGEPVRFDIDSDVSDEVHVHGYDLSKQVGPGLSAPFSFDANLEGIFEIELEERKTPIGELEVRP